MKKEEIRVHLGCGLHATHKGLHPMKTIAMMAII
jgi:hypothetical protein